jgi:nitrogenase molybdenum-iron protein alpha/beta subunit
MGAAPTGRPAGTGVPQTTKTPGKIGVKASEGKSKINADLVAKNLVKFDNLMNSIEDNLKEKYNKKRLSKEQKEIIQTIAETIATNESPKDWNNKINDYMSSPVKLNVNMDEINNIAEEYGLDYKTAILLYHSKL